MSKSGERAAHLEILKQLFYDPKSGFVSVGRLFKKARDKALNLTYEDVKKFYDDQPVNQVFHEKKINKDEYFSIKADKVGCIQSDLIDMSSNKDGAYKWIITFIDVNSRYAWAFPMTTKEPKNVLPFMDKVFKNLKYKTFTTDDGGEYKNVVNDYIIENKIDRYVANPTNNTKTRTALIERFNRSLLGKLRKILSYYKTNNWTKYLDDIVDNYNHTEHAGNGGFEPIDVFQGKITPTQKENKTVIDIKIGDYVRHSLKKEKFDKKGRENTYSDKVFIVWWRNGNRFILYDIDDDALDKVEYLPRQLLKVKGYEIKTNEQEKTRERKNANRVEKLNQREPQITMSVEPQTTRETRRKAKKRFEIEK